MERESTAEKSEENSPVTYTVNVGKSYTGVNIRKKPDENSEIVGVIHNGEKVRTHRKNQSTEEWIAISRGGYVNKKYLR